MRQSYVFTLFVLAVLAGQWLTGASWDGTIFVYMGEQRAPAAVRSLSDYSALDRKALFAESHRQMLEQARVWRQDGTLAVQLGNPLLKRAGGTSDFACAVKGRSGLYDRVELTFVGLGVAESGEQPTMVVEAGCMPGQNIQQLATIWLPMQQLLSEQARDQEFDMSGLHVRFQSIPGVWPENWVLWNVRLFSADDPDASMVIPTRKIREANRQMLSFEWKTSFQ